MGRTKAQQREYMVAYRARKKLESGLDVVSANTVPDLIAARQHIAELEEEVRHLKAELAKRPTPTPRWDWPRDDPNAYSTRPFTPVPRKRDK